MTYKLKSSIVAALFAVALLTGGLQVHLGEQHAIVFKVTSDPGGGSGTGC